MKPDESRTVYEGKLIDVALERWGGHEREIVEHPGAVAIVAIDRERQLWLVRQLREPAREALVELPAGTREPGEEPLASAQRELREECGLTGGAWSELGAFWTTPGFCNERMVVFLAEGVEAGEPDLADDEEVEVLRWPVDAIGRGSRSSRTQRRSRGWCSFSNDTSRLCGAMVRGALLALCVLALRPAAAAPAKTPLPGIRTPSGNIGCFFAPGRLVTFSARSPTRRTHLRSRRGVGPPRRSTGTVSS